MPEATSEQRTAQARKWYQEDVVKYIQEHPEVVRKENAEKLRNLKSKYKLILLTTNTQDYIKKILEVSNLQDIYEGVVASKTEKEPNKEESIDELTKKYGKPKYYITGNPNDKTISKFKKLGTKVVNEENINSINSP